VLDILLLHPRLLIPAGTSQVLIAVELAGRESRCFRSGSMTRSRRFHVVLQEIHTPGVFGGWIVRSFGRSNGFGRKCEGRSCGSGSSF
jgi:hypothetical protein